MAKSARFDDSIGLIADGDLVWKRMSSVDRIPYYWSEIKSVAIVKTEAPLVYLGLVFENGGQGTAMVIVDDRDRTVIIYFTAGSLLGSQRIQLRKQVLEVVWDVRAGSPESVNISELPRVTKAALSKLSGPDDQGISAYP